jgi:biotin transport system substrate-specific component
MVSVSILKKELVVNRTACRIIGVVVFVLLNSLGAFVRIPLPFSPVPITLQTFFVLLGAAFLGGRLGITAQVSYILLGIAGLPVFTNAGYGLLYLAGPTGGYLAGFVVASIIIAQGLRDVRHNVFSVFLVLCLADSAILGCGALWLKILFGYDPFRLLTIGILPFIPGDLLKVFLVSFLYTKANSRLKEIF